VRLACEVAGKGFAAMLLRHARFVILNDSEVPLPPCFYAMLPCLPERTIKADECNKIVV